MYAEWQFEQLEFCFHGLSNSNHEPCHCPYKERVTDCMLAFPLLCFTISSSDQSLACFLKTSKDSQGPCLVNVLPYKAHTFLYFCS